MAKINYNFQVSSACTSRELYAAVIVAYNHEKITRTQKAEVIGTMNRMIDTPVVEIIKKINRTTTVRIQVTR